MSQVDLSAWWDGRQGVQLRGAATGRWGGRPAILSGDKRARLIPAKVLEIVLVIEERKS
jgi:hypothetical protein